jgi:anti-anti-sigma regulatory factor
LISRCSIDEEDDVTLRITSEERSGAGARLRLEGRLVADGAALLERECSGPLRSRGDVSLDLAGVNFVDRAGVDALARLSRAGVEICCCPGAVASVLEGEGIRVRRDADDEGDRR